MPSGMFFGGLGSGLAGGYEKAQDLQLKREEAKLRTKMLDAQIKHMDAQQRVEDTKQVNLQNLMTTRRDLGNQYERATTGSTPGAPMAESPGDNAIGTEQVQGQPGAGVQGRPMQPHEMLIKAALQDYAHPIPAGAFRQQDDNSLEGMLAQIAKQQAVIKAVNPPAATPTPSAPQEPGVMPAAAAQPAATPTPESQPAYRVQFDAKGKPKLAPVPAAAARQPMDIASRTYFEDRNNGLTHDQALKHAADAREKLNAAGGFGSGSGNAEGRLAVTKSPEYLQNRTDIKEADTAGSPISSSVEDALVKGGTLQKNLADVRANFDPSFLGPMQGSDIAFDVRRKLPGSISGLGEKETKFRQSLADAKNQIVYLMSGKQINEAEGKRLNAALPSATDKDPMVFLSGLKRFEDEMNTIVGAHKKAGAMTRGQLGGGGATPTAPDPRSGGAMAPPPAGWR